MMREMIPLRDAIGRLADTHEAERDRLEAWAEVVAPKIAADLGVPLGQLRPVLDAYLERHIETLGEMTVQNAAELREAAESEPIRRA